MSLKTKDYIRHLCNNSWCVEIEHLALGTHADNMADKAEAGSVLGEDNPRAKLTEADVLRIRRRYRFLTMRELAKEYNVSISTISSIVNKQNWRHI